MSKKKQIKISLITPSYNQAKFVEKTISSVLSQNYENLEYIVIDGGSTDGSQAIIDTYIHRLAYFVSEKDRGQAHALNKGLEKATGEVIGYLNSDDLLCPGSLEIISKYFLADPKLEVLVGAGGMINEAGEYLFGIYPVGWSRCSVLSLSSRYNQPSIFYRSSCLQTSGVFNESLKFSLDLELFSRFIQKGYKSKIIQRKLAFTRLHADTKSSRLESVRDEENNRIFEFNGFDSNARVLKLLKPYWRAKHFLLRIFNDGPIRTFKIRSEQEIRKRQLPRISE